MPFFSIPLTTELNDLLLTFFINLAEGSLTTVLSWLPLLEDQHHEKGVGEMLIDPLSTSSVFKLARLSSGQYIFFVIKLPNKRPTH